MSFRERLRRQPPTPGDSRRPTPPADWPLAVRAGVEAVVLGWGVVVLPTLALYLVDSSRDAAAALTLGGVLRTGTGIWSLGFGGAMGTPDGDYGTLSLPLLGLTLLQAWLTRACMRRARISGPAAGAIAVLAAALTAQLIAVATRPAESRTWTAVIGVTVLNAAVTAGYLQRAGRGWSTLTTWQVQRPQWLGAASRIARELAAVLVGLAAVVALLGLIVGAGRVSRLHDAVAGGSLAATVGLVALQLGWLPTWMVWALSWLAGPGFVVGTGSVFSPTRVLAGAVPALPLLGGLPTAAVGSWGGGLPFVIAVAAGVVAWRHRTVLRELPLRQAAATAVTVTVLVALGVLLVCLAASGQIGPGRMAEVGPRGGYVAAIVALMVLVGVGLVAVLSHPRTRALTVRGVEATTAATGAAAGRAREHLKARSNKR